MMTSFMYRIIAKVFELPFRQGKKRTDWVPNLLKFFSPLLRIIVETQPQAVTIPVNMATLLTGN